MSTLSASGQQLVQELAQRHGVSPDAVTHMLLAVHHGRGTMAQFSHPEFGGSGQWMRGGMTMVGDMFNHGLKSRVDNLCSDISQHLASHQETPFSGSFQSQSQGGSHAQTQAAGGMGSQNSLFVPDPESNWWPQELGSPAAVGSQNNVKYAWFPNQRRLAVSTGGQAWVYDTLDHQIGGFAQQQGGGSSITLTSQHGTVNLATLPVISRGGVASGASAADNSAGRTQSASQSHNSAAGGSSGEQSGTRTGASGADGGDIFSTLERLGGLKDKGYITEEEFQAKKAELLSRL